MILIRKSGYLYDLGYDDIEMEQPTLFWLCVHLQQTNIILISFLSNFFLLPIKISIIIIASVGVVVVVVVVVVVIEDAPGTRKTQNPGDQDCLFASSTRR